VRWSEKVRRGEVVPLELRRARLVGVRGELGKAGGNLVRLGANDLLPSREVGDVSLHRGGDVVLADHQRLGERGVPQRMAPVRVGVDHVVESVAAKLARDGLANQPAHQRRVAGIDQHQPVGADHHHVVALPRGDLGEHDHPFGQPLDPERELLVGAGRDRGDGGETGEDDECDDGGATHESLPDESVGMLRFACHPWSTCATPRGFGGGSASTRDAWCGRSEVWGQRRRRVRCPIGGRSSMRLTPPTGVRRDGGRSRIGTFRKRPKGQRYGEASRATPSRSLAGSARSRSSCRVTARAPVSLAATTSRRTAASATS
jgi:hypothetical protein